MNILITGINGFIGCYVKEQLKKENNIEIFGVGKKVNFSLANYLCVDISKPDCINKILDTFPCCDVVIHLAASLDMNDGCSAIETNCIGTYNICRLVNEWNSDKLIYMSSLPVIGFPEITPVTEEHKIDPRTIYHVSKFSGEQIVNVSCMEGTKKIIVRIPSPIGTGMSKQTFLSVILRNCFENKDILLYGRGKRQQNYVDVRDVANAISIMLFNESQGVFNIAGEKAVSNIQLAHLCKQITNSNARILFADKEDAEENYIWDISIDKAKSILGYFPKYSIEDTIRWIYKNME